MKKQIGAFLLVGLLGACVVVPPKQQFVSSCARVGEAMSDVVALRRAGKIDTETFVKIDDLYDAAVDTCATLPVTDDAALIAQVKVLEFLSRATGTTGKNYGSY